MREWGTWVYPITVLAYLVAAVAHVAASSGTRGAEVARWLARFAWMLHSVLLGLVFVRVGPPMLTMAGSAFCLSWIVVLIALLLEWRSPMEVLSAFLLPAVVVLLVLATAAEGAPLPEAAGTAPNRWAAPGPSLPASESPPGYEPAGGKASSAPGIPPAGGDPSDQGRGPGGWSTAGEPAEPWRWSPGASWVWLHALVGLASYAAFTVAAALGIMYLVLERQLRCKAFTTLYPRLPPLDLMDRASAWSMGAGLFLFALTLIGGSIRAGHWWGPQWASDGKVLASVGAWCFYAGVVGFRFSRGWGGRRFAYLSILGFAGILFNYLLVGPYWSQHHVF